MSSLVSLPNELLLLIHSEFDDFDLLAHACYYLLCSRTRACYARPPPRFWRRLARKNGFGLSRLEEDTEATWRKVVVECAEHMWTCKHPACGERRYKENREEMCRAETAWPHWDYEEATPYNPFDQNAWPERQVASTLFLQIDFNNQFPSPRDSEEKRSEDMLNCAFLKPNTSTAYHIPDLMRYHPVALRTFATFPATEVMDTYDPKGNDILYDDKDGLKIRNPSGVTVYDVLITFSEVMGLSMTCKNLNTLLSYMPPADFFPETWTTVHILTAAPAVGSWFQLTHWQGFYEEEPGLFSCTFEPKQLPDDVHEHIKMYNYKSQQNLQRGGYVYIY